MASTTQQWEVVGKNKFGRGPNLSKTQKKQFIDNLPRVEQNVPLRESSTIYDAFVQKENSMNKANKVTKPDKPSGDAQPKKTQAVKKKKPENDKKPNKPQGFDVAIVQISKAELQSILLKSKTSFPENPDVWMKDLASYLNLNFEGVPEEDPVFKDRPSDFPVCKLDKGSKHVLVSALKECSSQTIDHLYSYCLQCMLNELTKGTSTYGYRIFLQLLAFEKTSIVTSKLPQYSELLKTHHNRPNLGLSILWALGQAGIKDIRIGLRVWINLMQPLLSSRSLASYAVDYLQILLSKHKDVLHKASGEISVREYFHFLDTIYSNVMSIHGDLKKKLQELYPKLKTIAYGDNTGSSLRNFFPSYLSRCTPKCNQNMKNELLKCLIRCLTTDKQSFSVWCQMYVKHLPHTSVLLKYMLDNWTSLSKKIDKKLLKETLRSFSVTNDELSPPGKSSSMEGLADCSSVCKELLEKLEVTKFPWGIMIFLLISVFGAIIAYDIFSSPSFKASRTVRFLDDYGILAVVDHVWRKISTYSKRAHSWMVKNIPIYYTTVYNTTKPYYDIAITKTSEFTTIALETTKTQRQWLYVKMIYLQDVIYNLSPETWSKCGHYLWLLWDFMREYAVWTWNYLQEILFHAYLWIDKNFISGNAAENLPKILSGLATTVHNYTIFAWEWCNNFIAVKSK